MTSETLMFIGGLAIGLIAGVSAALAWRTARRGTRAGEIVVSEARRGAWAELVPTDAELLERSIMVRRYSEEILADIERRRRGAASDPSRGH